MLLIMMPEVKLLLELIIAGLLLAYFWPIGARKIRRWRRQRKIDRQNRERGLAKRE